MNEAEQLGDASDLLPLNQGPNNSRNALNYINRLLRMRQNGPNRNQQQQPAFNNFRVGIAVTKIVLSSLVLLFAETHCNQALDKWLSLMIIYDALVIATQYLIKMGETPPTNAVNQSVQGGYLLGTSNQRNSVPRQYNFEAGVDEESGLPRQQNNLNNTSNSSRAFRDTFRVILLAKIQSFNTFYYIFLFLYGQMLYFNSESDCEYEAPIMTRVAYLYIFFQYLTFVIPFALICLCVLVLFVVVRRYGHLLPNSQVPATNTIINSLPTKKYPGEFPGDHECRICMCEYSNNEDIIQLQCNPLHHFHSECIKRWLKVNGICPICRRKLEEMGSPGKKLRY